MHGYEPGTVTPTTELVLAHKHPEDRHEVAKTIDEMLVARRAFSTRHRILDTRGVVHQVVVVGDLLTDRQDVAIGTHGYYVDITPSSDRAREDLISERLAEITEHRAVIEQAKGMLMLIYGLDDDAAFDLLRWRSQSSNVKLRRLAEKIVEDFRAARDDGITSRSAFDHALLTVGEGVGSDGDDKAASTAN
jgi:ANTAR domain-containing protein/PAS domain-containing protein